MRLEDVEALERLAALRDAGALTEEEFEQQRKLILDEGPATQPQVTQPQAPRRPRPRRVWADSSELPSPADSQSQKLNQQRPRRDWPEPYLATKSVWESVPYLHLLLVVAFAIVVAVVVTVVVVFFSEGPPPEESYLPEAPNVVCMHLDVATSELKRMGYRVDSLDASGENRAILNEIDWVVTSQYPIAGRKPSSSDGHAELKVLKSDEVPACD